jgi:hypothetical protein
MFAAARLIGNYACGDFSVLGLGPSAKETPFLAGAIICSDACFIRSICAYAELEGTDGCRERT